MSFIPPASDPNIPDQDVRFWDYEGNDAGNGTGKLRVFHRKLSCLQEARLIAFQQVAPRHYGPSPIATAINPLQWLFLAITSFY